MVYIQNIPPETLKLSNIFRQKHWLFYFAEKSGLILADTKFEFGNNPKTGELTLADEVLTPDSSRYWDKSQWEAGQRDQSFDKQMVRNWLAEKWDQTGTPPTLSPEIVALTAQRYQQLREKLTSH